jgi:hypothetical protein
MQIASTPGQIKLADGAPSQLDRAGREGDKIVSELHGRYYEKCSRGGIFLSQIDALTLLATHASPLTAGTGTPIIGIYNPPQSGVNIAILKAGHATTSGTPGGPLKWNTVSNPQAITGTNAGSALSALVGSTIFSSAARLWNNTAVTGSATGVMFRMQGGPAAIAAGAGIYSSFEEHAGDLVIAPGGMLALCCTAVGTTHIISAFVSWEEVAI